MTPEVILAVDVSEPQVMECGSPLPLLLETEQEWTQRLILQRGS